ncbi:hypothetical protein [Foetidibacter luteolus]|uniref:hypothetical protein n=1 Tax=Foetidibacter luteolus TaxID=2608880 RepID=UPI00129BEF69|nr:hypothetical protein [Foetidibacter luteolus]
MLQVSPETSNNRKNAISNIHEYFAGRHLFHLAFIVFITITASNARGQYYDPEASIYDPTGRYDIGFSIGSNNFLGDLGGNIGKGSDFIKDYTLKTVRPFAGISLNYYPARWYAITAGINYTQVTGADSIVRNINGAERWRYNRNLSFKSSILEGYIGAEFYILPAISNTGLARRITPYFGLGVGMFHFNPKTLYNGRWVELKPLRLEGQGFSEYPDRKEYKLTQVYFPVTAGLLYKVNPNMSLLGGFIFRHTGTDYIDDVATTYIDPALFNKYLPASQAALAKALYSRSKTPEKVRPGIDRADRDGNKKDSYVTFFVTLRLALSQASTYYSCWKN